MSYSNSISHRAIYDDQQIGIVAHSRPKGHPPVTTTLRTNDSVCSEIESLHEELTFDKDTKLVLLVSYATDEMIKIMMMYPEVYFMDCTGQANRQRRD